MFHIRSLSAGFGSDGQVSNELCKRIYFKVMVGVICSNSSQHMMGVCLGTSQGLRVNM